MFKMILGNLDFDPYHPKWVIGPWGHLRSKIQIFLESYERHFDFTNILKSDEILDFRYKCKYSFEDI